MGIHADAASTRSSLPVVLGAAAALVVAYVLGLTIGGDLLATLFVAGFLVASVVFWYRPFVGLVVLVAGMPLENMLTLQEGLTLLKPLGALLFAIWFVRKLFRGESWKTLQSPWLVASALFLAYVLASAIWAENASVAVSGFVQLALLMGLSVLAIDLVRSWDRMEMLARALVASGILGAVLTIRQNLAGVDRAGEAIAGGVNATAVMLVVLLPFAFYLFRASRSGLWRAIGLLYVPVGLAALSYTYSRMAFLLAPPVLLLLIWQTLRGKRGRGLLLAGGIVAALALSTYVDWDETVERTLTIPEYVDRSASPEAQDVAVYSGRGYHMAVALEIARDHPVIGVGYNNYGQRFRTEYQFVVGGAPGLYTANRSPHSSWLGILAELGGVGVLLWAVVLGIAIREGYRAWSRTRRDPKPSARHALVQTVLLTLLLYAIPYGLYFQTQKEKLVWALLGLAVVLQQLIGSGERHGDSGTARAGPDRTWHDSYGRTERPGDGVTPGSEAWPRHHDVAVR